MVNVLEFREFELKTIVGGKDTRTCWICGESVANYCQSLMQGQISVAEYDVCRDTNCMDIIFLLSYLYIAPRWWGIPGDYLLKELVG